MPKISQLASANPLLTGSEIYPLVQAGATVSNLVGTGLTLFPSGDTTGVTDYTNIQAAFAAMAGSNTAAIRLIQFSTGDYYVNAKLVFTFGSNQFYRLMFQGLGAVAIHQVTNNVGIWEFVDPTNGVGNNVTMEGIALQYSTQQTSANTAAVCLGCRCADSPPLHGESSFLYVIKRCNFYYGYRGIANTQPSGSFAWWDVKVKDCNFAGLAGAAVRWVSPTSVGQPNMSIENCEVGSPYLGGSEPIYIVDACENLKLENLETLSVTNQPIIQLTSCAGFTIANCKAESCIFTANTNVIVTQNSCGVVQQFTLNGAIFTAATNTTFLSVQNGQPGWGVTVNQVSVGALSGTGTLTLFNGGGGVERINVVTAPSIQNMGSGPAVFRITDSGGTTEANLVTFLSYPGGETSDDIGDASLTWVGFAPSATGTSSPRVNIWNTPLTAARTITLNGANGTAAGGDNLWDGAEAVFVRTANATGASTLTVSGAIPATKAIAIGAYSKWRWRRSLGWVETESGSL